MAYDKKTGKQMDREVSYLRREVGELKASKVAQKKLEMELEKARRAAGVLAGCMRTLVEATEESVFLSGICWVVVEKGGYRMSWVGLVDEDTRTLRPVAQAGLEEGYLSAVEFGLDDTGAGLGPEATAIGTGSISVAGDISRDASTSPWQEEARLRGYGSQIALPIVSPIASGERPLGVLSVYAATMDGFDKDDERLLQGVADIISYGIGTLRAKTLADTTRPTLSAPAASPGRPCSESELSPEASGAAPGEPPHAPAAPTSYDELTGLITRGRFVELVDDWIAYRKEPGGPSVLLLVGIDRLGSIMDAMEHKGELHPQVVRLQEIKE